MVSRVNPLMRYTRRARVIKERRERRRMDTRHEAGKENRSTRCRQLKWWTQLVNGSVRPGGLDRHKLSGQLLHLRV